MSLVEKLSQISKEIGFLEFDKKNASQGYGYASAAAMIRKLNQSLNARGIIVSVTQETVNVQPFTNTSGKAGIMATVTSRLTYTDGTESLDAYGSGSGWDTGDKAVMKASTAAYKYAIAHSLSLGWDAYDPEDDSREQPKRAPKDKPKKAKAVAPDPQATKKAIAAAIGEAKTMAELEVCKGQVLATKTSADATVFVELRQLYQEKKEALS